MNRLKAHIVKRLVAQFGDPRGLVGRAVGRSMATRSSNVQRTRWAVGLLDLRAGDRFLELGCGPGVGLLAARAHTEHVVGVDRSPVMVRQARRRSDATVHLGVAENLPFLGEPFDKVLAVNTVGHWNDPLAGLSQARGVMREGATIAIVAQARNPNAVAADSFRTAERNQQLLRDAGFTITGVETLNLEPPAVCVLATR